MILEERAHEYGSYEKDKPRTRDGPSDHQQHPAGRAQGDEDHAGGAEALAESPSAFERWCDNKIIQTIKPQKYNPFSVEPLVAYVLAKENEIKTVRIILTARLNGLEEEQIRERIREMYV